MNAILDKENIFWNYVSLTTLKKLNMNTLEVNLKKAKRSSIFAKIVIIFAVIYLLMILIKGAFLFSYESSLPIFNSINLLTGKIIINTYYSPISYIWNSIPDISINSSTPVKYIFQLILPLAFIVLSAYFVNYHKKLKNRYLTLENEIQKEEVLWQKRNENYESKSNQNHGRTIVINTDQKPFWHETWWGQIIIGVAVVFIAATIGLKTI